MDGCSQEDVFFCRESESTIGFCAVWKIAKKEENMIYQRITKCLTFGIIFILLAACNAPFLTADPLAAAQKLVKGFASAWETHDPDKLLSYYSEDVKSYDATSGGVAYDYPTIDDVLHHNWENGNFDVKISSFFVSGDGNFAATLGTYATKNWGGNISTQPYVSLLKIEVGKFTWIYDYYGDLMSATHPLQVIPDTASQPAASDQVVADTQAMITAWETAYNNRDQEALLSFYADQAKYTQVIAPDWNVFTKDTLAQDVLSKFSDEKFVTTLGTFFISADGHFVAVQATYDDARTFETPMVILLEVENGKIIEQYDYLNYKEVF
jgi:ketosteroid isomerase-like protein